MIPIVSKPYPDELLYSWICRLAKQNSLSVPSFINAYTDKENYMAGSLHADVENEYPSFYKSLRTRKFGSMKDLYLQLTTYQFESMAMTPGRQTAYINNVFRPKSRLNTPVNQLFTAIKICPECIQEDTNRYGHPYIHRSHQLSGVCTCYKHGCRLLQYSVKPGHECDFNIDDYEEVQSDVSSALLQAYTKYAQTLSEAEINANSFSVRDTVFEKMASMGYGASDNYHSFERDFGKWSYSDLSSVNDFPLFFRRKLSDADYLSITELLPVLMFLFPDATELIGRLSDGEPVLEMYTCPVCGREYCSTPQAERDGWGCPYCSAALSEDERFTSLVQTIGHREYQAEEKFESMNKKIRIRHKKCGREMKIKPRDFLLYGQRCQCEKILPFEEARDAVEAHDGFRLISVREENSYVKIYHRKCDHSFQCRIHDFLQKPTCRICENIDENTENFKRKMKALVGDEYTLIGEYINRTDTVKIRHNVCGCIQEYQPWHFLTGQRCKKCKSILRLQDYRNALKAYSDGKYIITGSFKKNYTIQNTETKETVRMTPEYLMQEIKRPTPSEILPTEKKTGHDGPVSAWDQKYQMLVHYKCEFGTADISMDVTYSGYPLGQWCAWQRSEYRQGNLKEEQVSKLNDLGFVWDLHEEQWNRKYAMCRQYLTETGNTTILKNAVYKDEKIGVWITTQKRKKVTGKLSDERNQKLLQLYPDIFSKPKAQKSRGNKHENDSKCRKAVS